MFTTKFRADDQGRFQVNPFAGDYFHDARVSPRGPALPVRKRLELTWTKGAVKKAIDIKLPRGVLIRGKVTEEGTGRPLAGASIQFFPTSPPSDVVSGFESIVASQEDGSFQVAVPPGKGHLIVFGPTPDYILREIGSGTALRRRPARRPSLLRPRHHRLRGQGRRRTPRGHRATLEPGKTIAAGSSAPTARRSPTPRSSPGNRSIPINLTWRAVQLHPRPRRPLRAARPRPGEGRAGLLPRRRSRVGCKRSRSPASRPART